MNKATKWEEVSFIISSSYRKRVLESLKDPKTPTKISKELNINKTHISKTLKELLSKKTIICLTPKANKGKLYLLSNYGKEILKEILKLN
ncbi:MAG: hypothetical protein QT10_C0011G0012 [archaeon GW2011_AR19]|nr:MAG: hypothetical protein QT10_C0011G0012 [archaeon GW2011_AR19]